MKKVTLLAGLLSLTAVLTNQAIADDSSHASHDYSWPDYHDRDSPKMSTPEPATLALLGLGLTGLGLTGLGRKRKK